MVLLKLMFINANIKKGHEQEDYYSVIELSGLPETLLKRRSLIICAISPWMTSMVVLQESLVAFISLSSVRFSWGSEPPTMNPPRPKTHKDEQSQSYSIYQL